MLRHPWTGERRAWAVILLLQAAAACFCVYLLAERAVAAFGGIGQEHLVRAAPTYVLVGVSLCLLGTTYAAWHAVASHSWRLRVGAEGVTATLLGTRRRVPWAGLLRAERFVEATRGPDMSFTDRRGVRLVGRDGTTIVAHEELEDYDWLRARVTAECRARGVPMSEKDGGWRVIREWKGSRGWGRVFVEHPVDEV